MGTKLKVRRRSRSNDVLFDFTAVGKRVLYRKTSKKKKSISGCRRASCVVRFEIEKATISLSDPLHTNGWKLNVYTCLLYDPSDGKLQYSVRPHSVDLPDRVHPGDERRPEKHACTLESYVLLTWDGVTAPVAAVTRVTSRPTRPWPAITWPREGNDV